MRSFFIVLYLFVILLFTPYRSFAGGVSGRVISLQTTKDVNTSGLTNLEKTKFFESLVVSKDNNGLVNSIVYIEKVNTQVDMPSAYSVRLEQAGNEFVPRVVPLMAGGEITIVNSDKIFHNVHAYFQGENLFIDNLPKYGQETKHTIHREGIVSMKCEVHLNMQAYVVVLNNPFFTTTDKTGKFTIKDLPPGEYNLFAWHEILGLKSKKIVVKEGKNLKGVDFIYEHITTLSPRWY